MATTVNLRKLLDRKVWEACAPTTSATTDMVGCESTQFDNLQLWIHASYQQIYDANEDSWQRIADAPIAFSSGYANLVYHPYGPSGTATAGSFTTLTTNVTMAIIAVGYTIRITGGTGAGQERIISTNTVGTNSVITVSSAWTTAPDATSTYVILTGRWYALTAQTPLFRYYDYATATWSAALSVTGIGAVFAMPSLITAAAVDTLMATGTATSATGTTLVNSGKSWTTNQFANSQVRITAGTGAGQVRIITSNTGTTLTVPTWTTNPDATSVYTIEQNYDYIYYMGNGIITYRYSISGNSWSTLSPGVARTTGMGNGGYSNVISRTSDATWANESNIKNGRYIYSFAGGTAATSAALAIYDIGLNTWNNIQFNYGRSANGATGSGSFNPTSGHSWTSALDHFYSMPTVSNASHVQGYKFNVVTNTLEAWTTWTLYAPSGGGSWGGKLTVGRYVDGATTLRWVYHYIYGTSPSTMYRQLVI